jgi:hypothetical protein
VTGQVVGTESKAGTDQNAWLRISALVILAACVTIIGFEFFPGSFIGPYLVHAAVVFAFLLGIVWLVRRRRVLEIQLYAMQAHVNLVVCNELFYRTARATGDALLKSEILVLSSSIQHNLVGPRRRRAHRPHGRGKEPLPARYPDIPRRDAAGLPARMLSAASLVQASTTVCVIFIT